MAIHVFEISNSQGLAGLLFFWKQLGLKVLLLLDTEKTSEDCYQFQVMLPGASVA